jgi:hypothetical protein
MSLDIVTRVATENDCHDLIIAFLGDWDRSESARIGNYFTADGVFDRVGAILSGRAAISEALRARPASILGRHIVTNFYLTKISADDAAATFYVTAYLATAEQTGVPVVHQHPQPMLLDFDSAFQRTTEGWRINQLRAALVMAPESLLRR